MSCHYVRFEGLDHVILLIVHCWRSPLNYSDDFEIDVRWGEVVRKCCRLISASQILLYQKKKKSGDVKMQTLIQ